MTRLSAPRLIPCLTALFIWGAPASCKREKRYITKPAHRFNPQGDPDATVSLVKELAKEYRMQTRTQAYLVGDRPYMRLGIVREQFWFFRTKPPRTSKRRADETQRFSLKLSRYRSAGFALRAFEALESRYRREKDLEMKGDVSFTLLTDETLLTLQSDCLMGKRLTAVFDRLRHTVLGGRPLEPGSLLRHHCGGGHTRE